MKTVSVDIKVPDGHEVAEVSMVWPGYQFATDSAVGEMKVTTKAAKPFLINGVPSDWPEWLVCDWVAKDKNGELYGYDGKPPNLHNFTWVAFHGDKFGKIFGTTLDIPGPWDQSLRENPRRKKA